MTADQRAMRADQQTVIAVDVGGTAIKAGLLDVTKLDSAQLDGTKLAVRAPAGAEIGLTEPDSTERHTGPHSTGPHSTGPHSTGPHSTERASTERGSTDRGSTESSSTGPDSTALDGSEGDGTLRSVDGLVRVRMSRPTPTNGDPDAVLAAVADVVATLRGRAGDSHVAALGLVVPGIIDEPNGVAVAAANVGWNHTPVRDLLAAETGLPVALGHDVRGACLAEWRLGAARGASRVLFATLGTGIGAGVVSEDRLLVGGGYAGQLGHIIVDPDGAPCGCGQRGCLATVASASAVLRRYTAALMRNSSSGPASDLTARDVAALARTGDPAATAVWCDAVRALAGALVTAVTVYGSELVVLGGGLTLAGDQLLAPVRDAVLEGLRFLRGPGVVRAEFADGSGVLGAALLARQLLLDE